MRARCVHHRARERENARWNAMPMALDAIQNAMLVEWCVARCCSKCALQKQNMPVKMVRRAVKTRGTEVKAKESQRGEKERENRDAASMEVVGWVGVESQEEPRWQGAGGESGGLYVSGRRGECLGSRAVWRGE